MATFFARGGPDEVIDDATKREALNAALQAAPDISRILVIPPDITRLHSGAGKLTDMLYELVVDAHTFHVMPALGTHNAMEAPALRRMFGDRIPLEAFKVHRWRQDLHRFGVVPADFVHSVSEGVLRQSMPDCDIPVEINKRLVEGGYSTLISIGQVVPHEVVGMANGFKNILVGAGGEETINRSHFLGAVYGMENMMGRCDTPVRRVLNYAHDHYLKDLGIIYVLTVVEARASGDLVMRGLYVGDGAETFAQAAALSQKVNISLLDEPIQKAVVYLDPEEFHSTWLGNKAIYRTRMAMADGGELIVLAPAVREFGENSDKDPAIDGMIRKYGYTGTDALLAAVRDNEDLRENLCAAAHQIHSSSEGRFEITYATDPSLLSREEVESVNFHWADVNELLRQYDPAQLPDGPNDGFFFISKPALGLWALRKDF